MPRFFLEVLPAPAPSRLPLLRQRHSATVLLDTLVGQQRVRMFRIEPPGVAPPAEGTPERKLPRSTIALGDATAPVISLWEGGLTIAVPLVSSRQIHYRRDREAICFSDDQRLLVQPGMQLDPRGLLCQLELVGVVPPFTVWELVHTIASGTSVTLDTRTMQLREAVLPFFETGACEGIHDEEQDEYRRDRLASLLDEGMTRLRSESKGMLFFSGGVDSGLIAARASHMNWRDLLLVHSTRGVDDRETVLARKMAAALRLDFFTFDYRPEDAVSLLPDMFDSYTLVNDFSILPTWLLARQSLDAFPEQTLVWDGSNADAIFGGMEKWRRARMVYRAPSILRHMGAFVYRQARLWSRVNSASSVLRTVRRTALWPYPSFAIALHALGDIAYQATPGLREEIGKALSEWLDRVGGPLPKEVRPKLLGLVYSNCAAHIQKPVTPVERAGAALALPFTDARLVAFALQHVTRWPLALRENKGVLKQLLLRSVPAEMVYRPKSGFSVNPTGLFKTATLVNALSEAIESPGPFRDLLNIRVMRDIHSAVVKGVPLDWYLYEFLWSLMFGHHWIVRTQEHAALNSTGRAG